MKLSYILTSLALFICCLFSLRVFIDVSQPMIKQPNAVEQIARRVPDSTLLTFSFMAMCLMACLIFFIFGAEKQYRTTGLTKVSLWSVWVFLGSFFFIPLFFYIFMYQHLPISIFARIIYYLIYGLYVIAFIFAIFTLLLEVVSQSLTKMRRAKK